MPWVIYNSADEATQIFAGILVILSMIFLMGANLETPIFTQDREFILDTFIKKEENVGA